MAASTHARDRAGDSFVLYRIAQITDSKSHSRRQDFTRHFDFERGFHAHKETQQFLICLQGSCEVYLELKKESETIKLEKNSEGILIGKEWHIMKNFSDDCILLVLANSYYDEKDYIRNYEEFLKYSNEK